MVNNAIVFIFDTRIYEKEFEMRKFLISCFLVMLVVGIAAVQTVDAKTFRWGAPGEVEGLDPYGHGSSSLLGFLAHIYEPLVRYDMDLKPEPCLALSWELVDDVTWRFKLRQGVKFHNGNEFTADDVIASLQRVSHEHSALRGNLPAYKDSRKVDDYTVDIILKGPYPLLLNDLTNIYMLDEQWLAENDALYPVDSGKGEEGYTTTHTNGTGPFMLESRQTDAKTVLTVNSNWWDEPKHNLTRIEFMPIGSSATRVAALLSGEIDFMNDSPLQDAERITKTPGVGVMEAPSLRTITFGLNLGAKELNNSNVTGKNPLSDLRVRQALYQAIDIDLIVKKIMRGKARVAGIFVAPEIPGYTPELNERLLPHDPEAAKQLLAEAGYPDGFEIGVNCPNDNYINGAEICQAAASMWAKIGIKANLTTEPRSLHNPKMMAGKTDIWMIGWATLPMLDSYSFLIQLLAAKEGADGVFNVGNYYNPEVNELIKKVGTELNEPKRREMMSEAFRIAKEDIPYIPLHQQPLSWAIRDGIQIIQSADNKVRLWHVTID